jgi:peptidoglycan hydrolase-like protein with peptidoglycan-binding domain
MALGRMPYSQSPVAGNAFHCGADRTFIKGTSFCHKIVFGKVLSCRPSPAVQGTHSAYFAGSIRSGRFAIFAISIDGKMRSAGFICASFFSNHLKEITMFKKLLIAGAVTMAFATGPSFAQQQGGIEAPNQRLAQERARAPGSPIFLSTAGVREIQQALNQAGFDVGNVDGQWSQQTAQAAQNYQRSQGLEPTGTLTLALINSLDMSDRLSGAQTEGLPGQRWAQEQAQGPGTPIRISTAGVRQIQQALNQLGYDVGNVDGIWNQRTARAAANFQQAQRLEPNGKPDVNLIASLNLTDTIFSGAEGQTGAGGNMRWRQETARGPGAILWASPATVRQIQQGLNQLGYDVGNVDGQWNRSTARAVQNFQRAQGLEPTGSLTASLLANIGMSNWMAGNLSGQATGGGAQIGQQQAGGEITSQQQRAGGSPSPELPQAGRQQQ